MPKILITGGLGFIFSHVTEYFVKKGWRVVVLDNLSVGSHSELIGDSFIFEKLDFSKPKAWEAIVDYAPDYIIHAAGITDVDHSIHDPELVLNNNIGCNINAFEGVRHLKKFKKFLYVSTDEIYGECEIRRTEADIIFPRNPYAASRAVGSLLRYSYENTYPELFDKTAEIRMCNVFGPRQDHRKILPLIARGLMSGVEIPLHNGGTAVREFLYVKNIPDVVDLILEKGHRVYNVTNNDEISVLDLISKAERLTGKKIKIRPAVRSGMDQAYRMDNTRLKELGWSPKYSFDEGLEDYFLTLGLLEHAKTV